MSGSVFSIRARFGSDVEIGTCWVAEPGTLVTAAHVVWQGVKADLVEARLPAGGSALFKKDNIKVFPKYPEVVTTASWKSPDVDVAVLTGKVPGGLPLPFANTTPAAASGRGVQVCGYPQSGGPISCRTTSCTAADGFQRVISHGVTGGGYSGSPVRATDDSRVVAVHVGSSAGVGFAVVVDATIESFIVNA